MTTGLRITAPNGEVILDTTTRITRHIATFETGVSNGSISFPELATGYGFHVVKPAIALGATAAPPAVTRSGTTISWVFDPGLASRQSATIIVMVSS